MPYHFPIPCMLRWFLLLLLLGGLSGQGKVYGQGNTGTVTGTIIDAQTKQPLGFATVFIAQTTFGTNAAENGTYQLTNLPAGSHELVVSFLGYETLSHPFQLQAGQQLSFRFELVPRANALQEVVVRVDPNWRANYEQFVKNFIGQTPNAAKTTITNTDVLLFHFDAQDRVLTAEASEPLVIENAALGYRLHYSLEEFKADFKNGQIFHAGYPRYEAMKPRSKAQQKRWEQARLKAFNGSLMHFARALYHRNLEAEGFNVRRLQRLPNPSRPPEDEIQAGLKRARTQFKGTIVLKSSADGAPEDSLLYWSRMARLDKIVAYLYKDPIPYDQLIAQEPEAGNGLRLQFSDYLNVVYTKEKEDLRFIAQNAFGKARAPGFQTSLITLTQTATFIEPSGMILNPYSHVVEGYWGWEKMADMLPLDYTPPPK
jgi:hypothetical protein